MSMQRPLGVFLAGAFAAAATLLASPAAAAAAGADTRVDSGHSLEIYHSPPILVRTGERVRIPVDVVCATAKGNDCAADVTLRLEARLGRAREATSRALPGLQFDLTKVAAQAIGASAGASVSYSIRAQDRFGRTVELPEGPGRPSLRFYVARKLPIVRVAASPFGEVRRGRTVLFLPWGSGPNRAGLAPGKEALTLGPSSFDLDAGGRIHLLDPLQRRLAIFSKGTLTRQVALSVAPGAQVATADDGTSYIFDSAASTVTVRRVDPSGDVGTPRSLGSGIPAEVDATTRGPFVNLLPAEAWIHVPDGASSAERGPFSLTVGKPLPSGAQLLRVATETFVRLATVRDEAVRKAVELRSTERFGEVALAEPDGRGGYWVVVRVWRERPSPADQYQVVHVSSELEVESFAVADMTFSELSPGAKFRLGADGSLYQMTTSADGVRIERYELGGQG